MINVVAFPWHNCTEECDVSVSSRLVSGGAEEAGMKGWREHAPVEIWYNTHVFLRGGLSFRTESG